VARRAVDLGTVVGEQVEHAFVVDLDPQRREDVARLGDDLVGEGVVEQAEGRAHPGKDARGVGEPFTGSLGLVYAGRPPSRGFPSGFSRRVRAGEGLGVDGALELWRGGERHHAGWNLAADPAVGSASRTVDADVPGRFARP
jgi:hypothetical protein